jgi:calcineurin-like phosphoesterase family protein
MGRVWYTSDTHFDHTFVAGLRGFATKEEHDAEIIRRWNSVVKWDDIVWHLGDVGMGRYARFRDQLSQLNGIIHLITGNHDEVFPGNRTAHQAQASWLKIAGSRFESVQAYARRKVGSYMFLLSHFPYDGDHTGADRYTQYRLRDEGMWLVHGHTHLKDKLSPAMRIAPGTMSEPARWMGRQLHVGLDAWDLTPVSQEQVISEMAKAELT